MRWVDEILNRNTLQCPFEMDDIDASYFARSLVQEMHLAFLKQNYFSAQKAIANRCAQAPADEALEAWAKDIFSKRISGCLNRYEILSNRHVSKRLETLAVAFYAKDKAQSGCYLGLNIHHRETGPVVISYDFGFDVKAVLAYA